MIRFKVPSEDDHPPLVPEHGKPTGDHSWFPPYEWTFATCWRCNEHLGWGFHLPDDQSDEANSSDEASDSVNGSAKADDATVATDAAPRIATSGGDGGAGEGGGGADDSDGTTKAEEDADQTTASGPVGATSSSTAKVPQSASAGTSDTGASGTAGSEADPGNEGGEAMMPSFLGLIVTKLRPGTISKKDYMEAGSPPPAAALMQAMAAFNGFLAAHFEGEAGAGDEGGVVEGDVESEEAGEGDMAPPAVPTDGEGDLSDVSVDDGNQAEGVGELSVEDDDADEAEGNGETEDR